MGIWKTTTLGELVEINKRSIDKNFTFDEIEYIDTSSVIKNNFCEPQKLKLANAPSRAKRLVKDNDIIYSTVRPIQRHYGFIKKAKPNTVVSTGFAVLSAKRIDPKFLFYYLSRHEIVEYLNATAEANTTTFPAFNPSLFENLEIFAPESIKEQKAIAKILSSLDERGELNRQMNATLEQVARVLFKAWFVDFEPVRANVENRPPASASAEIAKLFPSEFENGIPKGWRIRRLGEVLEAKGGTTPSTKEPKFWNGENFWATPKDLSNLQFPVLLTTERRITDEGVRQISSGILPKGTLLLSSRAPIGYLAISQIPVSINQGFIAIQGKTVSNLFLLHWLTENMEAVKSRANGSTFQEISKSNFREIEIAIPNSDLLQEFEKLVKPLFEKIVINERENQKLAQIRDSLLPRLISGKIRVGESENELEAAV
jgi:type I restriction enzyme S subunit